MSGVEGRNGGAKKRDEEGERRRKTEKEGREG